METLNLYNRDNVRLRLVHQKDNIWKLTSDKRYVLQYIRMGIDDDGTITFIDPPGGPFMPLGYNIENYEIVEFIDAITFRLNERNNDIS